MRPINLQKWMTELPEEFREAPFSSLTLPGTHDSATHQVLDLNVMKSGLTYWTGQFDCIPVVKKVITNWTRTQVLSIPDQFNCGVREFDLRLSVPEGNPNLFVFTHSYACEFALPVLMALRGRLAKFPEEVIILSVSHDFRNKKFITSDVCSRFIDSVIEIFGKMLIPSHGKQLPPDLTLNSIAKMGAQVLFNYPTSKVISPWAWRLPYRQFTKWTCDINEKAKIVQEFASDILSQPTNPQGSKLSCVTLTLTPDDDCVTEALKKLQLNNGVMKLYFENREKLKSIYAQLPQEAINAFNIIETDFADPVIIRWILALRYPHCRQ